MSNYSYHAGIEGFAISSIIKIFEVIGLPSKIADIQNENQRGPLLLTLAVDLALRMKYLLHRGIRIGRDQKEYKEFIAVFGCESFIELQRNRDNASMCEMDLLYKITDLEKVIKTTGLGKIANHYIHENSSLLSPHALHDHKIEYSASIKKSHAVKLTNEFSELLTQHRLAREQYYQINQRYLEQLGTIERDPDFYPKYIHYLKKVGYSRGGVVLKEEDYYGYGISVDFTDVSLNLGAANILFETDKVWWNQFVGEVKKEIDWIKKSGFIRILMRDPELIQSAKKLELEKSITSSGAWTEILRNPSKYCTRYWPAHLEQRGVLSDTNYRRKTYNLRSEDERSRIWMLEKGGCDHPCNWYEGDASQDDISFEEKYSLMQERMQLYWCLCRLDKDVYDPERHSEGLLRPWSEWIEMAESGDPKYLIKKSSEKV